VAALPRELSRFTAAGVLALVLSACQVTVRTSINANRDGSGTVAITVQLDHEAAQVVPDLAQQLQTSDLVKAGWRVVGPRPGPGNGVVVTANKSFANPSQASQVLTEVSGTGGPFHGFRLVRHASFFTTRTSLEGTVDLTCGLACFSDTGLQQQLGPNLGLDPARLQRDAGIILDRLFRFEVQARLPGSVQSSNAPTQVGNGAQWRPKLGDKAVVTVSARAWNVPQLVILAAVILLALLGIAVVVLRRRRRRRQPTRWSIR
jgi:hypothetical protein